MKKAVILLSAMIFSLALMIPSLMWADDGKHRGEGSGMKTTIPSQEERSASKEYKDKKHSKEYDGKKSHLKEGSAEKQSHVQNTNRREMKERSGTNKKMKTAAPRREGS